MSDHIPREFNPDRPAAFSLGIDALGRSWTLNLETGDVRHAPTETPTIAESNSTLIPSRELTLSRVTRILGEGGWEVTIKPDHQAATFLTEIGPIAIEVRHSGQSLQIGRTYHWMSGTEDWETPEERAAGVEALNRSAYFLRFVSSVDGTAFRAAYDLPLIAGLTRAQVLEVVRRFVNELRRLLSTTGVREGVE